MHPDAGVVSQTAALSKCICVSRAIGPGNKRGRPIDNGSEVWDKGAAVVVTFLDRTAN